MKNFKILFLFLSLILIFEIIASKEANAAACTVTNGVYSETEIKSGCEATPDFYEIVIYKMYLCTSTPTIPTVTAAADLTNCSQIFNSDAGASANVAQNSDVDLTGTYTRPPDGTYTHGYAMMDNTFGITAAIQIDGSMDGQASGSGVFCRTVSGSGNHTKASGSHTDESVCSATEVAAGKYTETLTHFGGSGDAWTRVADAAPTPGSTIKGLLVDSNGHLAANEGEVVKLEGLVGFANAITVTPNTTSLTMSFNLGEGMSLNSAGADKIYMGSGPFEAIFVAN
ncbi:hypothetical protein N8832_00140 [Candidatus Pelagibacter sp.]|nr:hypothetical protein [Candidatus Pelagibacter sp.]